MVLLKSMVENVRIPRTVLKTHVFVKKTSNNTHLARFARRGDASIIR